MTNALNKQILTYRDSVVRASDVAVECFDTHEAVQEMILMSPGMVEAIRAVTTNSKTHADPKTRQESLATCNGMLTCLTSLARAAVKLREHNFELAGLPELREATTELRFLMADLLDANPATDGQAAPPVGTTPTESVESVCTEMPPPQSWYDEDFTSLRGPVAK